MGQSTKKTKTKSKATKKGWRKTNVKDVEEHLENERLQLRTGGLVSKKKNSSLYVIDKKKFKATDKCRTKEEWRRKVLRNEIVHLNDTEPVTAARFTPKRSVKNQPLTERKMEAIEKGTAGQRRNSQFKDTAGTYDLWGAMTSEDPFEIQPDEYFLEQTHQKAPKPTKTVFSKPSLIPAVEVIHPGGSYNPSKQQHRELLKMVLKTEKKVLKKSQRIKNYFRYLKDGILIDEATAMAEMAEGLSTTDQSEVEKRATMKNKQKENKIKRKHRNLDEDRDSDSELSDSSDTDADKRTPKPAQDQSGPPPPLDEFLPEKGEMETQEKESKVTTCKPKSKKQKRKQLELKLMKRARADFKQKNVKANDIFKLKSLTKGVKQSERMIAKKVRKSMAKRKGASYRIKRLGKYKFEPMAQEFKLTNELPRSLRQLKPEGDPILDRYKSYQKRNYFEPRGSKEIREKKAKSRLRKGKYFEKKTYKEVSLPEEKNPIGSK